MIDSVNFDKMNGIVPAIVQDADTRQVLMVGFMNREALDHTLKSKTVTFWSRSRNALWRKGETSGNFLKLVSIHTDCDNDSLLVMAKPTGPVCHTGSYSCFSETEPGVNADLLTQLERIIIDRKVSMPAHSYTATLLRKGITFISQKVGEEAVETIVAALGQDHTRVRQESADLLYHLLVLLAAKGIPLTEVYDELKQRMQ